MSNSGRSNFAQQGRDVAAFTVGMTPVYARTNAYGTTKPIVEERFELATSSVTNVPGSYSYFEIGRQWDGSREWYLRYDRTAGTYTSGYDAPYFEDWEIYSQIAYVQVIYNNKVVWLKKGEQLIDDMMDGLYCDADERGGFAKQQNGMLSLGERQARFGLAMTHMHAPLQLPWRSIKKSLIHVALPNKIRLEVYWNSNNQCVHQPLSTGTVPGTIQNLYLITDAYHMLEEDRASHYYAIYNGEKPYQIKTTDWEYEWRYGFTAASQNANTDYKIVIPIRNLRNATYAIKAKLQYQSHIDNPQTLDRQKQLPIRTMYLDDQGKNVTTFFNARGGSAYQNSQSLMLDTDNVKAFPHAAPGSILNFVKFCPNEFVLDSENNCYGSRTISKYSNPDMTIIYNSSFNVTMPYPDVSVIQNPIGTVSLTMMYVTLISYIHQLVYQGQSDFRRFLLV